MEMTSAPATLAASPPESRAVAGNIQLTELPVGIAARVVAVADGEAAAIAQRLAELGFIPGERLRIVARGLFTGEPLAVRIGTSTFALRRFEAACIRVCPEPAAAR